MARKPQNSSARANQRIEYQHKTWGAWGAKWAGSVWTWSHSVNRASISSSIII